MKKLLLTFVAVIFLVSCAATTKAPETLLPDEPIDLTGTNLTVYDSSAVELQIGDRKVIGGGYFNYDKLKNDLGCDITVRPNDPSELVTKVLAGDSDVDIYFINAYYAKLLMDMGACEPIDSEIVADYVSKCFDCLGEYSYTSDGRLALMPASFGIDALHLPKKAMEELNIKPELVKYLDDFLDYYKNYNGTRKNYADPSSSLFYAMEKQYGLAYCDYSKGEFDYTSPLYRETYEKLLNGYDEAEGESAWFFQRRDANQATYKQDESLFVLRTVGDIYDFSGYFSDWTILPMPLLDESVTQQAATARFLYINPNSKNKEAATKLLEAIAKDLNGYIGYSGSIKLLFKDISMYPKEVDTSSELFREYVKLAESCVIWPYNLELGAREDVAFYQNGTYSLDEAIAVRSREIDLMLNE